jgi:ParB family chromosome partitioning protein
MERADGYQSLVRKGMTAVEIGKLTGMAPSTVTNDLALLELSDDTQDRVRAGKLTATEALRIVRRHRRDRRRRKGQPDRGAHWEPDWFTGRHPLARIAKAMCDAREHNSRRRLGNVACGQCFEDAIRADQRKIDAAEQAARERFASAMDERDAAMDERDATETPSS